MFFLLIPLIASAQIAAAMPRFSAASPGQIRFAHENKFDDTGPGAKEPEYAYRTYKNLDDALLAYASDPDTKLPPFERAQAIANLYQNDKYQNEKYQNDKYPNDRYQNDKYQNDKYQNDKYQSDKYKMFYGDSPRNKFEVYSGNRPKIIPIVLNTYSKVDDARVFELQNPGQKLVSDFSKETFRWHKEHARSKGSPVYRTENFKDYPYQYKPHPDVEFSIDVHDKETGDLKNAQELRDGSGTVHGYYTILANNGRRQSVHYQSNPAAGYKTSVQRLYK